MRQETGVVHSLREGDNSLDEWLGENWKRKLDFVRVIKKILQVLSIA